MNVYITVEMKSPKGIEERDGGMGERGWGKGEGHTICTCTII